ncbi:MAG: hypothetical protein ACE5I3_06755 [Phycisphaerae bacterium]
MSAVTAADASASVSRWHRLLHTPLRDLVRLRLSGRLDIGAVLAAAELPAPLAKLVRTTVRRTRLWRLEKVEVARELAAHFLDGIEAGATEDELVKSFGDPRQAAKLIRRAKRRNRPAAWKATSLAIRSVLACFGLLFLIYVGMTIRLHTGSPKLSRNYLAELNAPALAVPEQDRAWPLYREAFLKRSDNPVLLRLDPGAENWPELVAYAERNVEAIALYHAAARKPHLGRVYGSAEDLKLDRTEGGEARACDFDFGPPTEENPPLIGVVVPEMWHFRAAAKLLAIDAHIAAVDGDAERAYRDLETIFRIVEHNSESLLAHPNLVAIAILRLNVDTIGKVLADQPDLFSDEQLVQLSHRLAGIPVGEALRRSFAVVRLVFEDFVQRLYTDDGDGNGHLTSESPELLAYLYGPGDYTLDGMFEGASSALVMPAMGVVVVDRRAMTRKFNELVTLAEAEAQLPLWAREESGADQALDRIASSPLERLRYSLAVLLMPSLSRASTIAELATQRRDAVLAALACELYRRRNGDWPRSLADLSPRYLPTPPIDRFDGQPLRYRLIDGHPLIYSIGMDLDDDGGRVPEDRIDKRRIGDWLPPSVVKAMKTSGSPELPDGDWVLWPPLE